MAQHTHHKSSTISRNSCKFQAFFVFLSEKLITKQQRRKNKVFCFIFPEAKEGVQKWRYLARSLQMSGVGLNELVWGHIFHSFCSRHSSKSERAMTEEADEEDGSLSLSFLSRVSRSLSQFIYSSRVASIWATLLRPNSWVWPELMGFYTESGPNLFYSRPN